MAIMDRHRVTASPGAAFWISDRWIATVSQCFMIENESVCRGVYPPAVQRESPGGLATLQQQIRDRKARLGMLDTSG
jgi:hypothetical protein